jgi:hypothetical protein
VSYATDRERAIWLIEGVHRDNNAFEDLNALA